MNTADMTRVVIILMATLTIYVQLRRLRDSLLTRRFAQVIVLIYFVFVNLSALTTTDVYILRSGILTNIGVLFLLVTVMLDRGDC